MHVPTSLAVICKIFTSFFVSRKYDARHPIRAAAAAAALSSVSTNLSTPLHASEATLNAHTFPLPSTLNPSPLSMARLLARM